MKLLVCALVFGEFYEEMSKVTLPRIKSYASKCGADFSLVPVTNPEKPAWNKFNIKNFFNEYDRVLYVDIDILIRDDAENLFNIVPEDELAIFDEGDFIPSRKHEFMQYLGQMQLPKPEKYSGDYFNTGVFLISKCHADVLSPPMIPQHFVDHYYEQSYLNFQIQARGTKIYKLNYKYNRMSCMCKATGEYRGDSYFLHYAGAPKESIIDLMKKDIEIWEDVKHNGYVFKKNIGIIVGGGIGDAVCCEPAIRFLLDKVYTNDNVVIKTDWPILFDHLPATRVISTKDNKNVKIEGSYQDVSGYHLLETLPLPPHFSWFVMTQVTVHSTDYAALQLMRRTLPLDYKQPKIPVPVDGMSKLKELVGDTDLSKCVILHPGKHWQSKTFPSDVWQSYKDILIQNGYKVILLGKTVAEDQGVVEFDYSGTINLIDKTDFSSMLALLNACPVLISNDSGPIHLASSFDNHIGLIATCKHPDHILHHRSAPNTDPKLGSQYYKAKALERQPLYYDYDMKYSTSVLKDLDCSFTTEERLRECVPLATDILQYVNNIFTQEIKG